MKKRITAVILSLTLVLTMFVSLPIFAASEPVNTTALEHLLNLGIVDAEFVEDSTAALTRGRFAALTAAMANLYDEGCTAYFSDVTEDTPYSHAISSCVTAGFIHGYEDGTFRPDQPVTGVEAAKIFVILAGYYSNAYYKGGYTAGILRVANQLDLFSQTGITNPEAYLTNKQAATMALNTLLCEYCAEVAYDEAGKVTYAKKGISVAEQYLKVIFDRGIMQSNGIVRIEEIAHDKGMLTINGTQYSNDTPAWMELLGQYVEYFYDKETNRARSVVSDLSRSKTLLLRTSEIIEYSGNRLTYTNEDDVSKTISISSDALYLVNGKPQLSYDLSKVKAMDNTEIYFVGNQTNKSYQIVFINQYTDYIVGRKSTDGTITDRFDGSKSIVLDEENYEKPFSILSANGSVLNYDNISQNNVISVLQGEGFIRVKVSKKTATGKLEQIFLDHVTIAGKDYELSALYDTSDLNLGTEVTAYINAWNEIVYITEGIGDVQQYGYLYRCVKTDGSFSSELRLKLYTITGEIKEFTVSGSVNIDNDKIKLSEIKDIPEQLTQPRLIGYIEDGNGKITQIFLPKTQAEIGEGKHGFYQAASKSNLTYHSSYSCFEGKQFVNDNTIYMQVGYNALNGIDEKWFAISSRSVLGNASYLVDIYYFDSTNEYANVVVSYENIQKVSYDSGIAVCKGIYNAVDENGNQVHAIEYFMNGKTTLSYLRDEVYKTSLREPKEGEGDLLRIFVNGDNYVTSAAWVYHEGALNSSLIKDNYTASLRAELGYVAGVGSKILRVSSSTPVKTDASLLNMYGYSLSSPTYVVIEGTDDKTIYTGKKADLAIGDKVVVVTRSGSCKYVFIYKD